MIAAERTNVLSIETVNKHRWDAIVIGAGTGGTMAARKLAEKGLDVLILDKKPVDKIGKKVCGDAIGAHHFMRTGVRPPTGEELDAVYAGVRVFSADGETVYVVEGRGFSVNRLLFGQRLLREAIEAGAKIFAPASLVSTVIDGASVKEVVVRARGEILKLKARLYIDASGWTGSIRRDIAEYMGIERDISGEDMAFAYREVRELSNRYDDGRYADIFLDVDLAPGGYWWIFPKREGIIVNVGLGLQFSTGGNPRRQYEALLASKGFLKGSKIIETGAGIVPTRRPMDNLVWNGVMLVGDAASTANPLHGGGIGHSMFSGLIAGEIGADALKEGDLSMERLWEYNVRYMKEDGSRNAKLDVFRIFLQRVTNRDINLGMRVRVIDERSLATMDIDKAPERSLQEKIEAALKLARRPSLLRKLLYVRKVMRQIETLYFEYPETPKQYPEWRKKIVKTFEDYKRHLRK